MKRIILNNLDIYGHVLNQLMIKYRKNYVLFILLEEGVDLRLAGRGRMSDILNACESSLLPACKKKKELMSHGS